MIENRRLRLVGEFIKARRESLRLSQRALGLLFEPPVTTQFISNIERGVTPLPPIHVPALAKILTVSELELMVLLEKEFAHKLSEKLGNPATSGGPTGESNDPLSLVVANSDYPFMKSLYESYRVADEKTRKAFETICENMLKLPKSTPP